MSMSVAAHQSQLAQEVSKYKEAAEAVSRFNRVVSYFIADIVS